MLCTQPDELRPQGCVGIVRSYFPGIAASGNGRNSRYTDRETGAAAVGQAELITQYQNCFDGFNQTVAQVLLTQDVLENRVWRLNAEKYVSPLNG
jgi:glutamate 5-kinase